MATAPQTLKSLLPQWHSLLKGWAADGSIEAAAQEALVLLGTPKRLHGLIDQWDAGDLRNIPEIMLLPNGDINGAMGAYAIRTGKIYLNQDWLLGASTEQVFSILTEELTHHLEGVSNTGCTTGDEQEYSVGLANRGWGRQAKPRSKRYALRATVKRREYTEDSSRQKQQKHLYREDALYTSIQKVINGPRKCRDALHKTGIRRALKTNVKTPI